MITTRSTLLIPIFSLALVLVGCTPSLSTPTLTVSPSPAVTPDPCIIANLPTTIKPLNDLTRQFDDYSTLAFNTPQSQIIQLIPPMQTLRRNAQDQTGPACLQGLKNYQLAYMNTTIETLLVFQSNPKSTAINTGIAQAHLYHDQYTIELARLLGVTLVAAPTRTATTPTTGTTTPLAGGTNTGFAILVVTNPGPNPVNLRSTSSLAAPVVGILNVGQSTTAVAQSGDGKWYQVDVPGQPGKVAWLDAALVQVDGTPVPAP